MHGIVLKSLKDFVVENYGEEAWVALHEEAGLRKRIYVPVTEYPDEIVLALVEAAVELTGVDQETLLYEFGRSIVPQLVSMYHVYLDADWTAFELIANVETHVHQALRAMPVCEFTPPAVRSEQVDESRVLVHYESDRGLCPVARGVLVGVGEYYNEPLHVREQRCQHRGNAHCEIVVSRDVTARSDEAASRPRTQLDDAPPSATR